MPKNIFKKLLPKADKFKEDQQLRFALGERLRDNQLWGLNRNSISRAIFIGLFCSFLPIPFQMVLSGFLAWKFKANLPLSISLVWISNPITILPIMYTGYYIGSSILGTSIVPLSNIFDINWLWQNYSDYWVPLLLGSTLIGFLTASLGYAMIQVAWRINIQRNWKIRQLKREKKNKPFN